MCCYVFLSDESLFTRLTRDVIKQYIGINSGLTYTAPGFWMVKHQLVYYDNVVILMIKRFYKWLNIIIFLKAVDKTRIADILQK